MKRIILFISIYLLSAITYADNVSVTLAWSPSCNIYVAGYKIYSVMTSNSIASIGQVTDHDCSTTNLWVHGVYLVSYSNMIDAGNVTSYTFSNLYADTTYVFSATAYDTNGVESDFSGQAIYRTPMAYTNGGTPPKQSFVVSSYTTNWFSNPIISTNRHGIISTNYYSLSVRTLKICSDLYVRTNWIIEMNTNLLINRWFVFQTGSNSIPTATVTNTGGNAFFRIKI